ncbi:dihydrofolate reductase [Candidatus Saccharibacteria bacterium]|nr:dihydrofolate reductase [Candidatus Saccharibacteria bacterium]
MKVSIVVAASQKGVIGKQGGLPWHLPDEMARFKQITMGHPIIMGRKTHESIGRALPGRQNIIVSRDKNYLAEGCEVVSSIDEALAAAKPTQEVFIIGGANLYNQVIDRVDKIYLTRIKAEIDGDTFFDFDENNWKQILSEKYSADQANQYAFEFQEWIRK